MSDDRNERSLTVEELQRFRDELRVQLHLATAEARDEWNHLEEKWKELQGKLRSTSDVASQSAEAIGEATKHLVEEIGKGYERIKKAL